MTRWLRERREPWIRQSSGEWRETADKVIRLQTVSQDLDKVTIPASRVCEWEGEREQREEINQYSRRFYSSKLFLL